MADQDMVAIQFRDKAYSFPAAALGGTKEAPKLKPADELLLNWALAIITGAGYAPAALAPSPAERVGEGGGRGQTLQTANLLHDHYGVLTTCLPIASKAFCSDNVLHLHRMHAIFSANHGDETPLPPAVDIVTEALPTAPLNLLHLPKSLDLFEIYLLKVAATSGPTTRLAAAFQTRHFTPRMLATAAKYANTVSQSRAYKKARLLLLSDFKKPEKITLPQHELEFAGKTYRQFYGVFSAKQIDLATRFLLEEWARNPSLTELPVPKNILDIGCGNGIIGDQLLMRYPEAHLVATDVSRLALASAQQNYQVARPQVLTELVERVQWTDRVDDLPAAPFDLIVTNPPFHDGHRNTIGTSLGLFRQVEKILSTGGHFIIVANRHLNYATHLRRLFPTVKTLAENRKFVIYCC
ncbi:MAG: methyltransferase, partial [Bacteroidota bacterium]